MEGITTREKLILAGMEEVRAYGIEGFSLRRVAARCGVSPAAPYKHFADKQEMFIAMVDYVNERWNEERQSFVPNGSIIEAAADYTMRYIGFLCANPHYKSVLMIKETGLDSPEQASEVKLSVRTKRLIALYRREKGLSRDEIRTRIFIARSLVFGAVFSITPGGSLEKEKKETLRKALISIFA